MVAFMVAWVKNWIFVLVSACFLWEKWTLNLCKLGDLIGNHLEQLAGMLLGEAFAVRQNINSNNWCTFPSKRLFLSLYNGEREADNLHKHIRLYGRLYGRLG